MDEVAITSSILDIFSNAFFVKLVLKILNTLMKEFMIDQLETF